MEEVNWTQEQMLEVGRKEPDDFLKVRETLSRIGVASRKESKVVQKLKKYHSVPSEDKECIGCGEKEKDKRMRINPRRKTLWTADHDHKTGKFRGYLCDYCNTILARANDDSETLIRLAKYLEKHKKCMN